MRYIKLTLALSVLTLAFSASALASSQAAVVQKLMCRHQVTVTVQSDVYNSDNKVCDLGITKTVSVNGGAYTAAESSSTAVVAKVGDTVSYKITVSNTSTAGYLPYGQVTVKDTFPTGVTAGTSTPSVGTYVNGVWTFTLTSNLPATLTLTGTVNANGFSENVVAFATYCANVCPNKDCDPVAYVDANSTNNQDQAYVNAPVVVVPPANTTTAVTTTTVTPTPVVPHTPDTGVAVSFKNPIADAAAFFVAAAAFIGLTFKTRAYAKATK